MGKSNAISARRRLLEEVLAERSKTVALLELDVEEPPGHSRFWPYGLARWAVTAPAELGARRQRALECCQIAFAWLEAIDAESTTGPGERREE